VEALFEIWLEKVYTPKGFYSPANGDVIVDVGANIGLFTIFMSRWNRTCRLVALEPFGENIACLQANIRAACPGEAVAHQIALGAASGKGHMTAVGQRSLDHTLSLSAAPCDSESVDIIPLTGLFDLAQTQRIALLKVDIEGAERQAFERADSQTLRRIDRLAIEYHDHLEPGTLDLLMRNLGATHRLTIAPSSLPGCGILLASRLPNPA
jgi:FkbM family methyltransferase